MCVCGWAHTADHQEDFDGKRECYAAYAQHILNGQRHDAASMNATRSHTGRVRSEGPEQSVDAARAVDATGQRGEILGYVKSQGFYGLTSKEVAGLLDVPNMNSNRASSRLQELWELGLVTLRREHGCCALGSCRPHDKPGAVHLPNDGCITHGRVNRRDGAGVWIAL